MCIHKALLSQAIAASYGINTEVVSLTFAGQIDENGNSDNKPNLHAVLRLSHDDVEMIADAHKGIYEPADTYWQRFAKPFVYSEEVVFEPATAN